MPPDRTLPVVRFIGVRGIRSSSPSVVATVDDVVVTWRTSGWLCECGDPSCPHVDAVAELLDDRVTGEARRPATRNRTTNQHEENR
ncbi:UNVERIFIED_ORG: hypothetical protein E4P37_03435 [Bacillus sp. AZ43]